MNWRSVVILSAVGVLIFSISFMNELQNKVVSAQNGQLKVEDSQAFIDEGDVTKVITIEKQAMRENNPIAERDNTTEITAEKQNMVEKSTVQPGFVQQENGTGFFLKKWNIIK